MDGEHRSWPQLVGKDGAEAVNIIKSETGRRLTEIGHRFFIFLSRRFY